MRIIVSFTSIPARLTHLRPVIENMCQLQTRKPDQLRLYLPETFARTGEAYIVPQELTTMEQEFGDLFQIVRVKQDKGPITKVYYALREWCELDDVVISIDDDVFYHAQFVQELARAHETYPHAMLGFMGNDPPTNRPFVHAEDLKTDFDQVHALGGYRGILYPRNRIGPHFFAFLDELETHTLQTLHTTVQEDDNFVASYCKHMCIPMFVVKTQFRGSGPRFMDKFNFRFLESSRTDALYGEAHQQKMQPSMDLLVRFFATHQATARSYIT